MHKLKHTYQIDFVVPAKPNFKVTKRLKEQSREGDFETTKKNLRIEFEKLLEDAPD